jgi:hypothetical protein
MTGGIAGRICLVLLDALQKMLIRKQMRIDGIPPPSAASVIRLIEAVVIHMAIGTCSGK